jgi:hypothetical protein
MRMQLRDPTQSPANECTENDTTSAQGSHYMLRD